MKASMKRFLLCITFMTLESALFCSQLSKNQSIDEKQARAMILQSAQAIQSFDTLIESKENEKTTSERILEWYEVVLDNNMNEYEKARDQNIPVIPYDAIVSRWNYYQFDDLSGLEKLSYNNIVSTELTIATLNKMSAIDQWKYFHENVKKPHITSPAQFISYLECKLADHKQILQDSVHAARSHRLAQFWLSLCMYPKNFIKHQQQILEKLSQEEDELRYYRDEYQLINSELKELWDGDEQAALTDRRAQLTMKLLQQDSINSFQQQHKILQSFVNEKILAIGRVKAIDHKHAKKERKLMAAEDVAMYKFLLSEKQEQELQAAHERAEVHNVVDKMMQQVIDRQDIEQQILLKAAQHEQVEQQKLLDAAELIKKQAKKEKERAKLARKKQAAKELKQQAEIEHIAKDVQEKSDALLQLQIQAIELACNQSNFKDTPEKSSSHLKYQAFLADMQGQNLHDLENYNSNIQLRLKEYAYAVCDEDMTDEKMENFYKVIKQIFLFNQLLQAKDQRISWYVSLNPKIYKKMRDRFIFLDEKYGKYDGQCENIKALMDSLQTKCHYGNIELLSLQNSLKKAKDSNDKEAVRKILTEIMPKKKQLYEFGLEYNKLDIMHKNMKVLHWMTVMHGSGGILNIERLGADIDFSTWKDGNLSEAFISKKIQELHNAINDQTVSVAEDKKFLIVQKIIKNWLQDYFGHIELSSQDSKFISEEISQKISDLAYTHKIGHIDTDNLEYSLHKSLEEACASDSIQYTQLQLNDVVQIQLTLMQYLASIILK